MAAAMLLGGCKPKHASVAPAAGEAPAGHSDSAADTEDTKLVLDRLMEDDVASQEDLDAARRLLEQGDEEAQLDAATALARHGDTAGLDALLAGIRCDSPDRAWRSAWRLADLGKAADPARERLRAMLEDSDTQASRLAAIALGYLGDPAAADLLTAMLSGASEQERTEAAWALYRLPKAVPNACDPLVNMLNSGEPTEREAAAAALSQGHPVPEDAHEPLLEHIGDPDPGTAHWSALALSGLDDAAAVPVLIDALERGKPRVRGFAPMGLAVLRLRAAAATQALVAGLDDPSHTVRTGCVLALGYVNSGGLADPDLALPLLADEDVTTRLNAALALARSGDPRSLPVLGDYLGGPEETLTRPAYTALAYGGLVPQCDLDSWSPLADTAPDKTLQWRAVVEALAGRELQTEVLSRVSDKRDAVTAAWCNAALAAAGDADSLQRLQEAVGSDDPTVRDEASTACKRFGIAPGR